VLQKQGVLGVIEECKECTSAAEFVLDVVVGGITPLDRVDTAWSIWPAVLGKGEGGAAPGDMGGVLGADDVGVILPETTSG
jgi:hypothetical protein